MSDLAIIPPRRPRNIDKDWHRAPSQGVIGQEEWMSPDGVGVVSACEMQVPLPNVPPIPFYRLEVVGVGAGALHRVPADRLVQVLRDFGMQDAELDPKTKTTMRAVFWIPASEVRA